MGQNNHGVSLAEVLLVTAILIILAGIALPTLSLTVDDAKVTAVEQELMRVRTGIDYYKFQHLELLPGLDPNNGNWTTDAFNKQLTWATTQYGEWASPGSSGYPFGPYLLEGIPNNPFNDLDDVIVVPAGASASGYPNDNSGWVYFADDGTFRANTQATTSDGGRIYDL
ncbi:MAG: type II secretion system protein [Planctomycetota bacterium]|nr:MAG: type II secretion system protein [Planctomycetota bacterium]